jgi:hypothetical protein
VVFVAKANKEFDPFPLPVLAAMRGRTPYSTMRIMLHWAAGLTQIRNCGQWQFASGGLMFNNSANNWSNSFSFLINLNGINSDLRADEALLIFFILASHAIINLPERYFWFETLMARGGTKEATICIYIVYALKSKPLFFCDDTYGI